MNFKTIILAAAILLLATTASASLTDGLLVHYAFDEGFGAAAADSSGNANNGTFTDSPAWASGMVGSGALEFDGVDDAINLSAFAPTLDTDTLTISFWIRPSAGFSGTIYRLSNSSSGTTGRSKYEVRADASAITFITGDGVSADTDAFSGPVPAGTWSHVLCTLDASKGKTCYLNGSQIRYATNDVDSSLNSPVAAFIGTNRILAGYNFIEGTLDDMRIYGRALEPQEIRELYDAGTTTGLVARILATPTSGSTPLAVLFDASASSYPDGTAISYQWSFGDGTTGTGANTSHTYGSAGTYMATLTVTDDLGTTGTARAAIRAMSPEGCSPANVRCVPLEYGSIQGCLDVAVAGDTCKISEGAYAGFTTVRDGGAGSFISITGAGAGSTTINTTLAINHKYHFLSGVKVIGADLEMNGSGASHNIIEGSEFTRGHQSIHMQIMDNEVCEDGTGGPSFNLIRNNVFYEPVGNGMVAVTGHDNNVVMNVFRDGKGWDALRVFGVNQLISDNRFLRIISDQNATGGNHADIIQTFSGSRSCMGRNVVFERNYIQDSGSQFGNMEDTSGKAVLSDWTFRNNIFVNSRIQLNIYIPRVKIYNNTVYGAYNQTPNGFRFAYSTNKGSADFGQVYNNIFFTDQGFYSFNGNLTGTSANNNIIANLNGSSKSAPSEGPQGINGGIKPEDVFLGIAANDFRLKPGSMAIGMGKNLSGTGFSDDFSKTARPQGPAWDAGAYEYSDGLPQGQNDSDLDGVPDSFDRCPRTALAARAYVNVFGCSLPIAAKFDIKPDFNATDINGLNNLELGVFGAGKISYASKITLVKISARGDERLDIDADLNITQSRVTLNQNNLPQLSQSATITLYNTSFKNPKILKDGVECTACRIAGYDRSAKTITFSVPGF